MNHIEVTSEQSILTDYVNDERDNGTYTLNLNEDQTRKLWDEVDAQTLALMKAEHALRIAHNALVWWQAGIEAKQPHNVLDEKTVANAIEKVRAVLLKSTKA